MQTTADDPEAVRNGKSIKLQHLPPWFRVRLTKHPRLASVRQIIRNHALHTVCHSAACPNRTECWNAGTATFLILGDRCTRGCRFCNVRHATPDRPDRDEPNRVAEAVRALGLRYAVVTSVTRDDLPDGGASFFASTIRAIRDKAPGCRVEVLIPDFQGSSSSLDIVLDARPDVLGHNVETVPSHYPRVRPGADYHRSLELLRRAQAHGIPAKSGLMLGLGENADEVLMVMRDIRDRACSILTLGQYLQPRKTNLPVVKYYHPDEFEHYRKEALALGFLHVASGPLVRSSYHAERYGTLSGC